MQLRRHRCLITGASGFIGGHLSKHLAESGWHVHVLMRRNSCNLKHDRVVEHKWDETLGGLQGIFAQAEPDVVFHLASCVVIDHGIHDLDLMLNANIRLALYLLEAMYQNKVCALINTGTVWQHFEGAAYDPVALYAATKQAAEDLIKFYTSAKGLRAITLLLPDSYGPGDMRKKVLQSMRAAMKSDEPVNFSPGEQLIDLLHVDDIVSAYVVAAEMVLESAAPVNQRYALSSGNLLTLKELVGCYERVRGRRANIRWGGRPYRTREVMDPRSEVQILPGWAPEISISEGLATLEP